MGQVSPHKKNIPVLIRRVQIGAGQVGLASSVDLQVCVLYFANEVSRFGMSANCNSGRFWVWRAKEAAVQRRPVKRKRARSTSPAVDRQNH